MYRAMSMRWKLQQLNQFLTIFTLLFSFPNNGRSWIFSLKNQPITLYRIYLAFKIFSFNLPAKQRVKIQLEFECGNGYFKNFLTRVYFPCPFAFSNHWQSLSQYFCTFFVWISIYFGIKRTSRLRNIEFRDVCLNPYIFFSFHFPRKAQ